MYHCNCPWNMFLLSYLYVIRINCQLHCLFWYTFTQSLPFASTLFLSHTCANRTRKSNFPLSFALSPSLLQCSCGLLDQHFQRMVSYKRLNPEDVHFSSGLLPTESSKLQEDLPVRNKYYNDNKKKPILSLFSVVVPQIGPSLQTAF